MEALILRDDVPVVVVLGKVLKEAVQAERELKALEKM